MHCALSTVNNIMLTDVVRLNFCPSKHVLRKGVACVSFLVPRPWDEKCTKFNSFFDRLFHYAECVHCAVIVGLRDVFDVLFRYTTTPLTHSLTLECLLGE